MMQEALIILHGGHGQVTFLEYLLRVLLYLLAFTTVAMVVRWWVNAFESINVASVIERDAEDDEY